MLDRCQFITFAAIKPVSRLQGVMHSRKSDTGFVLANVLNISQ